MKKERYYYRSELLIRKEILINGRKLEDKLIVEKVLKMRYLEK